MAGPPNLTTFQDEVVHVPSPGLRDQFAMAALTAVATLVGAMVTSPGEVRITSKSGNIDPEGLAAAAYEIADAMLKAREESR